MADGKGCKCAAYSSHECGCDADWTPQEVYDLRAKVEAMEKVIKAARAIRLYTNHENLVALDASLTTLDKLREIRKGGE